MTKLKRNTILRVLLYYEREKLIAMKEVIGRHRFIYTFIYKKLLRYPEILLSSKEDLAIYDIESNQIVKSTRNHPDKHDYSITCISRLHGCLIATGSIDLSIRIWDLEAKGNKLVKELRGHKDNITKLFYSHGDIPYVMFSVSNDYNIISWDLRTFSMLKKTEAHCYFINDIVYLGPGLMSCKHRLVTASSDCTICLWDLRQDFSMELLMELKGHFYSVTCLVLFGSILLSGGLDRNLILWNPESGNKLAYLNAREKVSHLHRINEKEFLVRFDSVGIKLGQVAFDPCFKTFELRIVKTVFESVCKICFACLFPSNRMIIICDFQIYIYDLVEERVVESFRNKDLDIGNNQIAIVYN